MSYATLTAWIKGKPRLASVRLDHDNSRVIRIVPRQAAVAEKAILDSGASVAEGLDLNGQVVRTWTFERDDSEDTKPETPKSEVWPSGDQAQLAQVITIACDRAAMRHEGVFKMAFDKLSSLYEQASNRLAALEEQYHSDMQLRLQIAQQQLEQAAADREALEAELAEARANAPSGNDGLVQALVTGAVTKSLSEGSKPNGKAATP